MAQPSVFSEDQISAFLNYIGLPPSLQQQRYTGDASKDIHFLTQLHIHAISKVPYENLWLHYNPTHTNNINPNDTYTSIVTNNRGRGGYCFQVSIFFNHILRGLGFPAYLSPVRIRYRVDGIPQGNYSGWVHLVNVVTLTDGSKWALDVGFGGDGPTAPIQLVHNHISTNLGNQEVRLWRDWIPTQLHRTAETKLWIYQYRNGVEQEWNSFYAFGETEAMEADFFNLNWYTGSHPESFQTFTCIIVKFLRREKGDGSGYQEIYGKRMLVNGVVKENLGGKTAIREDCRTEEERVRSLEEWFGMKLTEEERAGIRGWGTELKGDGSEGVIARQAQSKEVWEIKRGKEWRHHWKDSLPA
ncbi:arylamine N-acetyltransferase [Parastagonospora nodorum]|nr:arylamine N-acetyltransferase [Parastagonospora nodorum]KAH5794114.1 arylamine N-acetyltransferase [Parastagonospora nodorum]KAH5816296.1 arylamine N-acetyltransferase [Parastagonospora nodorum]KAH5829533.1 arylamine N-acetyltransferase [Parastagonospora nodorum]KAH5837468.1 arylamine N-acetyltransferase [Parastagonospora nodorum]